MRDPDDEWDEDEEGDEDVIALQALAALLEVEGDDELAWAQREALGAVADEAMAFKARRQQREARRAAERHALKRARREEQERAEREEAARAEAARVEAARQARAAREAAEARARVQARAEREERARREQEARQEALRRQRAAVQRRAVQAPPRPVSPPPRPTSAVERARPHALTPPRVRFLDPGPSRHDHREAPVEQPEPTKEPARLNKAADAAPGGSAPRPPLGPGAPDPAGLCPVS